MTMDALDEVKWAAGFFDGEGTTICNSHSNSHRDRTRWKHQVQISVSQSEHRPGVMPSELLTLKRLFGGSLQHNGRMAPRYRQGWRWVMASALARRALAMMRPFLHEAKQEQTDRARVRCADRRDLGQAWETERRAHAGQ